MIQCRLKVILKEHNLTQKELCDAIKARPSTICDLCNNNAESLIPQNSKRFSDSEESTNPAVTVAERES